MKAIKVFFKVIGFALLAALLAVILGLVTLFFYLKMSNFDVEKQSVSAVSRSSERYENGFSFDEKDDSLVMNLSREDVMWLLEYSSEKDLKDYIEYNVPVKVELTDLSLKTGTKSLVFYGDGTIMDFLTVHVRIEAEAIWNNGKLWVSPKAVFLGNKIVLTSEWFQEHGIMLDFSVEISEDIKDLTIQDSGAVMTIDAGLFTFGMDNVKAEALQSAQFCYLFQKWTDDPRYSRIIDVVKEEMYGQPRILFSARDLLALDGSPEENMAKFMGMATEETVEEYLNRYSDFSRHFVLDSVKVKADSIRDELFNVRIDTQKTYEDALNAAKLLLQEGDIRVERDRMVQISTGETVVPSLLDATLSDEGGLYLLITGRSAHPVKTDDMPVIRTLSFAKGINPKNYPELRAAAGLLVKLPSGDEAICYYLHDGTFVVNAVTEEYIKANLEEAKSPRYILEDDIPKPSNRPLSMKGNGAASDMVILDELAYLPVHVYAW